MTAIATASVVALGLVATGAIAQQGAEADKHGWWFRAQGPQDEEPDSPVRPVVPKVPQPPNVPPGAVAVGAQLGEPDKVGAVGIVLDAPTGARVTRLVMTLREVNEANAIQNAGAARIVACPILDFWAGTENGDWRDRPAADCEGGEIEGERDGEARTWSFDLTPFGTAWLDAFGDLFQNGVVLLPAGGTTFQIVVEGSETEGGITFDFAASGGGDEEDPFDFGDDDFTVDPGPAPGGGFAPPPGGGFDAPGDAPIDETPDDTTGAPDATDDEATAAPPPEPPRRAGNVLGNLPLGAPLALLALTALLALVAFGLGPAGAPGPKAVRRGGVTRALEARGGAARPNAGHLTTSTITPEVP